MSKEERRSAAKDGDITQLKLLVSMAKGNVEDDVNGRMHWTVLYCACSSGRLDCVEWLLVHCNANVDACTHNGTTPLIAAAAQGGFCGCFVDVCKMLIQHNADIEATDNHGRNALYWAIYYNKGDNVCILIEKGAIIANVVAIIANVALEENNLSTIPDWVHSFIAQREQCRQSAIVLLASLRKGRVASFQGNGKDLKWKGCGHHDCKDDMGDTQH
jgi:ankyrin repeat protein